MRGSVLITGASGYIGAHVAKALYDTKQFHIVSTDIDTKRNDVSACSHLLYKMDVRDLEEFRCYEKLEYDIIIHLGALVQVGESMEKPREYYNTNLNGTMNVIRSFKHKHFIYASTAGAFDPVSPYAKSKLCSEDVIRQESPGYTIFRFFNVAGNNGEFKQHGPSTHLIRVAAEVAAGKRDKMVVYGNDYPTRDGTCVRDYIHVVDLANAVKNAALSEPKNNKYECLGSNKGFTNLEVLDIMKEVSGVDFEVEFGDRRPGDPAELRIDGESEYLNIEHDLRDMCRSAYEMELKNA
jgi:UDP-glucose 4-epimerase